MSNLLLEQPPNITNQRLSVWVPLCDLQISEQRHLYTKIKHLSTHYSLPHFLPHITIMGGLSLVSLNQLEEACKRVACSETPFKVTLNSIHKESTYYKNIYGTFDEEGCEKLKSFHRKLRNEVASIANIPIDSVDSTPLESYEPHISFTYGIADKTFQQFLVENIEKEFFPSTQASFSLMINEIAVVDADLCLETNKWKILHQYAFRLNILQKVDLKRFSANILNFGTTLNIFSLPSSIMAIFIGRLLFNFVYIFGKVLSRSLLYAYRTQNLDSIRSKLTRRMAVEEARKILDIESEQLTLNKIHEKFLRLYNMNAASNSCNGSPYLQHKICVAKFILGNAVSEKKNS